MLPFNNDNYDDDNNNNILNVVNVTYQNIKGGTNIFKLHPCKLSIQL